MKNRILISDLSNHIDQEVTIKGWVSVRRDQGKMIFFDFRDRTGYVQGVVLPGSVAIEIAKEIKTEYVVSVTGKVNKRPERNIQTDKQNGDIELEVLGMEIISAANELPFASDADLNLDTLLDYRPLTLRREREKSIFKTQQVILTAFREYLDSENFVEFQAPRITGSDAEGGAGVFKLEYLYNQPAYLSTSPPSL
jgi:aspartyl-tRNA synthetase